MIDPKLNELAEPVRSSVRTATDSSKRAEAPRQGLSINDTIAADANLSVGGVGTDTSGVRSGAGAGAGSTYLGPGKSDSPAPSVQPGARSTGTTPLSNGLQTETTPFASDPLLDDSSDLSHDEISSHAYQIWLERGSPHGSAHEDWDRAVRELRERRAASRTVTPKSSAASA